MEWRGIEWKERMERRDKGREGVKVTDSRLSRWFWILFFAFGFCHFADFGFAHLDSPQQKKRSLPIVLDREGLIFTREFVLEYRFDYLLIFIGVQMN